MLDFTGVVGSFGGDNHLAASPSSNVKLFSFFGFLVAYISILH